MSNELVVVEPKNVLALFTEEDQIKAILDQVEFEVKSFEHDMTNDARRKKTASLARKVASTKTYLDGLGKDLVSDWKAKAKIVDGSRKKMRDRLDELKAEARKPLTEWEEEQKAIEEARRVEAEKEAARVEIESDHEVGLLMNEKRDRDIADALAKEIESERLRIEQEEKDRAIREANIAKEAKEKAERESLARENQLSRAKWVLLSRISIKHSAKIHNEMMQAIIASGFEAGIAKAMVILLKDNKIPHVGKVQY